VVLSFGRFELRPGERLLTEDGAPLELGARTLDTLIALASRPNEVVSKRELMATVWPDVTVEEGSLRFHIAGLRKALGDGKNGARYIATLAGRGYCFVAPVTRTEAARAADAAAPAATFLPARLARMVGREDDIAAIAAELSASRFVTIVGPGGVGKTTVAIAVAHSMLALFQGAVLFVDFGLLSDSRMVPATVASMLGLSIQSDDALPSLIAFLGNRRMLVVLDTCEHVVEDAARFTARLFLAAPGLHILATSREALRVEGEHVHRLSPLRVPPDDAALTAETALNFPAARLFVERATASGAHLDLAGANATLVADICRKLDGMALAIELAAGRVEAYGLSQIATLLDQRFTLLWSGNRTAPARQKTLQATLEWSYGLLSDAERVVFRRLAIFVGAFTIEAALAVVTSEAADAGWVFAAIDSLVDKSMVMSFPTGAMMRYRLLDTTSAFARLIGIDCAEHAALAARHATYWQHWLAQFASYAGALLDPARRASHLVDLNNVRAALAWCFGSEGDLAIGVDLAAAAAPVFFAMSLLPECRIWAQRAIAALEPAMIGGRQEMRLQAALGLALMWIRSNSEATHAALNRSMAIANERGDALTQMVLLAPLHVFHMLIGAFRKAMQFAEQVDDLSRRTEDADAIALARILIGYSRHFAGGLRDARQAFEAALNRVPAEGPTIKGDALAAPILALATSAAADALARNLWLQGDPAAAMIYVNRTLRESASTSHPVTFLVALIYAISVLIWNGDLDEAERQIARFIAHADTYASKSHVILGYCFQGQLAIARGNHENGFESLQARLNELRALRYELLTTSFNLSLVEALTALGRLEEGLAIVESAMRSVETNGDLCYMPELLRLKAKLLLGLNPPQTEEAEACLAESLATSRRQGARAWELRTTIDLAKGAAAQGRPDDARAWLQTVVDQFAEGSTTADLRISRSLLARWRRADKHLRHPPLMASSDDGG
jgi:predicted ATPase/DNA-binding winged helix-turn-helix (wHTH) protein